MINDVQKFLKTKFEEICKNYDYELLDISIEKDHVHFAIKLQPTYSIGSVVRNLKSITGYHLFKEFPKLRKKYFWNSGFWTSGYFVSTVGNVSKEKIMEYIKSQENYEN
jgi:putative transposase